MNLNTRRMDVTYNCMSHHTSSKLVILPCNKPKHKKNGCAIQLRHVAKSTGARWTRHVPMPLYVSVYVCLYMSSCVSFYLQTRRLPMDTSRPHALICVLTCVLICVHICDLTYVLMCFLTCKRAGNPWTRHVPAGTSQRLSRVGRVHTHTHTHTHTYTHTHTHTFCPNRSRFVCVRMCVDICVVYVSLTLS